MIEWHFFHLSILKTANIKEPKNKQTNKQKNKNQFFLTQSMIWEVIYIYMLQKILEQILDQ